MTTVLSPNHFNGDLEMVKENVTPDIEGRVKMLEER